MGCGGSKDKLTGAEKPLDSWMEQLEMETIDNNFARACGIINTIENKRQFIVDELETIYQQSGAIAYKTRDLGKALRCVVWKLGVDNDGKVAQIGFDLNTNMFGGAKNSTQGTEAGNLLLTYCKNILEEMNPEDLTSVLTDIEAIAKDFSENMDNYAKEISDKCLSNPFDGIKKLGKLKNNLSKCKAAIECLKDLVERLKMLAQSAPAVMSALNPASMLKELPHVEKAYKSKHKDAVEIAWNLVDPAERHGKSWQECVKEAQDKVKARNEYFAKYAKYE